MSSRRYRVDQELEIYNFRVVPDLQISKKVELLMIYMFFLFFFHCFAMNEAFWRIQKLSSIPPKSGTRDLEF